MNAPPTLDDVALFYAPCPYCQQGDEPIELVLSDRDSVMDPFDAYSAFLRERTPLIAGWRTLGCMHFIGTNRWTLWVTGHPGGYSYRWEDHHER